MQPRPRTLSDDAVPVRPLGQAVKSRHVKSVIDSSWTDLRARRGPARVCGYDACPPWTQLGAAVGLAVLGLVVGGGGGPMKTTVPS
jgi:hypothetical protein